MAVKPPYLIFVVEDFFNLCSDFIEKIGIDNFICELSDEKSKIQTSNPESYHRP